MGTNGKKSKRKVEHLDPIRYQYYIYTEGTETEPNYFEGFKRHLSPIYQKTVHIEIVPEGRGTSQVLSKAYKRINYQQITSGSVWCVYDKDNFTDSDFNIVPDKMKKYNTENPDLQYFPAWNNECFEIWIIWHFSEYTSNSGRQAYFEFLNKKWAKIGEKKYHKNITNIFEILYQKGNPRLAIKRAKQSIALGNGNPPSQIVPSSTVYQLVEELAKFLPQEILSKFE